MGQIVRDLLYAGKKKIEWMEVLAGEKAFKLKNDWLPEETLAAVREYVVSIKGPLTTILVNAEVLAQKAESPATVRELEQIRGAGPDFHAMKKVEFPLGAYIEPLPG